MNSSVNYEEALVNAFIDPRKRERYLGFVTTPKKRDKFLRELGHFKHLNPKYVVDLKPSERLRGNHEGLEI